MNESYLNSVRNTVLSSKPSKAIRLLLMVLLVFMTSNVLNAQTASSTWALNANGDPANVGNVSGTTIAFGSGLNSPSYSAVAGVTAGSWSNDAGSLQNDEYYEFEVTPNANTVFNVTAINFEHSRSNGNWLVRAYYSIDNFATSTPIANAFSSNSSTPTSNNNTVNIDVENTTLTVRIYGWESDGNNRSLRIRNIVISGTTCAKPSAAGTITGTTAVCQGENTVNYSVPAITNATGYTWTLPAGATIVSGANTRTITVNYSLSAISGNITVQGTNSCGSGTVSSGFAVVVNTAPTVTSSASPTSVVSGGNVTLTASVTTPTTQNTVLLSEGFNGATNTWTKINNSSGGTSSNAAWNLRSDGYSYAYSGYPTRVFHSNDNSQFYLSNSAAQGNATTATILQSPAMSTVGYTSLSLEFYQYNLDFDGTDYARVEVSTNGSSWTTLSTTTTTQGAENYFLQTTINLNAYVNQSTLYIRFRYDAEFDWFWAIDNVTVSGNKTIPYTYSWSASPSGTAGLPSGAGTASTSNNSIIASPTANTVYTVTATNPVSGCTGTSVVNVSILAPTITSISPSVGCVGSTITINGTNLSGATTATVQIGGTAVSSITFISATQIVAVIGSGTTGNVTVTNSGGTATSSSVFIVNTTPTITPNKVDETCSDSNNGTISPVLSGGLSNVRYIKLIQKYASWQQVAEIQAFEIFTNTNVALASNGATATSSSNYPNNTPNDPNYGPQLAIDNEFTASLNTGFWHSNSTSINEYIQVDLQAGKKINYIRIHNRVNCCWERGQNMLLELYDASNNLVYSKTVNLWEGVNGAHFIDVNVLDVSWADGATTLNRTALDSGTYTLNYSDAVGCSASSPITIAATNTTPSTPTVGTITQPDCVTATGSVVLTGLPAGNWTINPGGINGNTSSTTISGLAVGTYNFTVSSGSCSSSATGNVVINPALTNTWTGVWSQGTPNATQRLVFAGTYPPAVDPNVDITGCSCMVTGGAAVTIKTGKNLIITNEVTVVGGGSLTFENNASLVQINNAAINSGNIIYKRTTSSVLTSDYTYWSSPVANHTLNISPFYTSGTFYSYNDFAIPEDWKSETSSTVMLVGKGYIIRGPQVTLPPPPGLYNASFVGVPNNGTKTIAIGPTGTSNLLGNPYPSAIDADKFLAANITRIEGTIYIWTHNTAIQLASSITNGTAGSGALAYTSDDYASYNVTGGVGTGTGNFVNGVEEQTNRPTGKIAAGQAFFTTSLGAGTVTFNNAMRLGSGGSVLDNSQFFKIKKPKVKTAKEIEKHRIWLNLTNSEGAFKQTLVGYITDATNDYDSRFDGQSFDANEFVDFYSIIQDNNLVIQGRALPFDQKDEVPLGFKTAIEGTFDISIDEVDGLLTNQPVFLEDKLTNTVFDLKTGNYTFKTTAGTFDDRFVLKYENASETLNVDETDKVDGILVLYSNNYKTLIIQNKIVDATVNSVSLFNMSGQSIAVWSIKEWEEQSNIQIPIKNLSSGIYIVKVQTTKGESNKKIIVN